MFCVMLMSWWLGGPLEDMRQVKLYLIHTSSRCCCKLELDFKVSTSSWRVDCCSIVQATLFGWEMKADLDICHFLSCIISYWSLFWGHSFSTLLRNTEAWCSRMWPCVLTPLFFTVHSFPSPSRFSKGRGHGTLISPYPLYPSDCPTLTPPRLPVFALALHRTSVTAPATAARSLPSPIPPQAC